METNSKKEIINYLKKEIKDYVGTSQSINKRELNSLLKKLYGELIYNPVFIENETIIKNKIDEYCKKILKNKTKQVKTDNSSERRRKTRTYSQINLFDTEANISFWFSNFKKYLKFVKSGNDFKLNYELNIIEEKINKSFLKFYELDNFNEELDDDLNLQTLDLLLDLAKIDLKLNDKDVAMIDDRNRFIFEMLGIKLISGGNIQNYLLQSYAIDNGHDFKTLLKDDYTKYLFRVDDVDKIKTDYKDLDIKPIINNHGINIDEPKVFYEILKNEKDITDDIYFLHLKNYLENTSSYIKLTDNVDIIGQPFSQLQLNDIQTDLKSFFDDFLGNRKEKHFVIDIVPVLGGPKIKADTQQNKNKKIASIQKIATRLGYPNSFFSNFLKKYLEKWEIFLKIPYQKYLKGNQLFILEDVFDSATLFTNPSFTFQSYLNSLSLEEINFIAFITKLGFDKEFTLEGLDISKELIEINKCFNKDVRSLFTLGYSINPINSKRKMVLIFKETDLISSIISYVPSISILFIKVVSNSTNFIYEEQQSPSNFKYAFDIELLKSHNLFSKGNISNIIINFLHPSKSINDILTKLSQLTNDKKKLGVIILIYLSKYFIKLKNPIQITGGFFQVPLVNINEPIDYNTTDNSFDTSLKINIGRALFDFKKAGDLSKVLFVYYFNFFINKYPNLNGTLGEANKYFDWNLIYTANDQLAVLNSIIRKQNSVIYADQANFSMCIYKSPLEICSFQFFLNLLTINLKLAKLGLVSDILIDFQNLHKGNNDLILINYLFMKYNNNDIIFFDGINNKMLNDSNYFVNDILTNKNLNYFNTTYPSFLNQMPSITVSTTMNDIQKQNKIYYDKIINKLNELITSYPSNSIYQELKTKLVNNYGNILNNTEFNIHKNLAIDILILKSCDILKNNPDLIKNYLKELLILCLNKIKNKDFVDEIIKEILGINDRDISLIFKKLINKCINDIINNINVIQFTDFNQIRNKLNEINLFMEIISKFLMKNPDNIFDEIYRLNTKIDGLIINIKDVIQERNPVFKNLINLFDTLNKKLFYVSIINDFFKKLDDVSTKLTLIYFGTNFTELFKNIKFLYTYSLLIKLNNRNYSTIIEDLKTNLNTILTNTNLKKTSEINKLNDILYKEYFNAIKSQGFEDDLKKQSNGNEIITYIMGLPQPPNYNQQLGRQRTYTSEALNNFKISINKNYEKIKNLEKNLNDITEKIDVLKFLIDTKFNLPNHLISLLTDSSLLGIDFSNFKNSGFINSIITSNSMNTNGGSLKKITKKYYIKQY